MQKSEKKIGTLYVVATPIGNLQDITFRALEVLKQVDRIIAEDTRRTGSLLKHFNISKSLLSLHEYNEKKQTQNILSYLQQGEHLALVSDAGTPLISDPGFPLIRSAKAEGIKVIPIPGACAAVTALSVSGLSTDKFIFEGFLPAKTAARRERLQWLKTESRTMIFYEAPHRLLATLEDMQFIFGEKREATVARELTKIYESILTTKLSELLQYFNSHSEEQCGELVIIVSGQEIAVQEHSALAISKVLQVLLKELPLKQAVLLTSKITGERKNVVYEMGLQIREKDGK